MFWNNDNKKDSWGFGSCGSSNSKKEDSFWDWGSNKNDKEKKQREEDDLMSALSGEKKSSFWDIFNW